MVKRQLTQDIWRKQKGQTETIN